jgi:phosphate transport system substrate-binding protein
LVAVTPRNPTFTIDASPGAYLPALAAADRWSHGSGSIQVSLDTQGTAIGRLCGDGLPGGISPDMVELSRRITADEFHTCTRNGSNPLVEVKIGYQAVLLARGRLYGTLRLSARDIFLALAKRIPDPGHPETLIENPYRTWIQIDDALPYDHIQVIGPAPDSTPGKLATQLLLEAGCNSYPWIAALRGHNEARYHEICDTVRSDGAYEGDGATAAGDAEYAFTEKLVGTPTALGILTLPMFRDYQDTLVLNPIDDIEPTDVTLADHSYPAGRTLYLYIQKRHARSIVMVPIVANGFLDKWWLSPNGFADWGLVQLDETERAAMRADLQTLKELQF